MVHLDLEYCEGDAGTTYADAGGSDRTERSVVVHLAKILERIEATLAGQATSVADHFCDHAAVCTCALCQTLLLASFLPFLVLLDYQPFFARCHCFVQEALMG